VTRVCAGEELRSVSKNRGAAGGKRESRKGGAERSPVLEKDHRRGAALASKNEKRARGGGSRSDRRKSRGIAEGLTVARRKGAKASTWTSLIVKPSLTVRVTGA